MPYTAPIQTPHSILRMEHFPYGDRSSRYGAQIPVTEPLYSSSPREAQMFHLLWRLLQIRCKYDKKLLSHRIHDDTDSCTLSLTYEVSR